MRTEVTEKSWPRCDVSYAGAFHLPGGVVYKLDFMVFYDDGRLIVSTLKVCEQTSTSWRKTGRGALSRHDTGDLNSETRSDSLFELWALWVRNGCNARSGSRRC